VNTTHEDADAKKLRMLAETAILDVETQRKAARAKSAEDWFDIFTEVTRQGVFQTAEVNGNRALAEEKWAAEVPGLRAVRDAFRVQGMELNESIDCEGPLLSHDSMGFTHVAWPNGMWAKFIWTDGSTLDFQGRHALLAVAFVLWWTNFNLVHTEEHGGSTAQKSRIVDPNSDEYRDYMSRKKAEQSDE